ncbi:MAG: response regulator [Saprospiraceae bacterium]|nr:response regulator [Lewinella sp.]
MEDIDLVIIEDSQSDVHLMERALHAEGIPLRYHWVKDGAEAIEFFSRSDMPEAKVVLLDIKLPKVNGFEVLKYLKTQQHTSCIPVVIFSSSQENRDLEAAYKMGANSYLTKPESYHELKALLRNFSNYWLNLNKRVEND